MKKLVLLSLAAATALGGCATDMYGDDSGWGYYDRGYYHQYGVYDYNHPDPRYNGYYPEHYYREDPRYHERVLTSNDRIYRGSDGRYYCRRADGSTGVIVSGLAGGVIGGVIGNLIAPGDSKTLGTVLGAAGGAAVGAAAGSAAENSDVRCR
ncbi:MAG: glycine zipper 2TM domain-containing protein [Novosphingobium sp.]|nr:glycine zipper 2TM domain-containing protein [Novosphingobium sp.]